MKMLNRVFINAISATSSAGNTAKDIFDNILNSNSSIEKDLTFNPLKALAIGKIKSNLSFNELILKNCENILNSSNLTNFEDTILIVGSSVGGIQKSEEIFLRDKSYKNIDMKEHNIYSISNIITSKFKFKDIYSFSTACTSSGNALIFGYEIIKYGISDKVLVVGADSLSLTTVNGFDSLGVLSPNVSKPFDTKRDGMNVSEAIGCILLENSKNVNSIEFYSFGSSSDAYNITHPHSEGKGAILTMQQALKGANLKPNDIDYINAHGTGTIANDRVEANSIYKIFKDYPYISSTKSITGHSLGASSAIEAIISTLVLKNSVIPKNRELNEPEHKNIKYSIKNIEKNIKYILSNSFAFGGNNTSILLGKPI